MNDDEIVEQAAGAANTQSPAVASLIRAIVETRSEAERHELANRAAARAEALFGTLSVAATTFLRVAVFALA